MKSYLFNVALGLDLFASAILAGKPGETISGRVGKAQQQGKRWAKILAPVINFVMRSPTHCRDAIVGDRRRALAVIADGA